MKYASVPQGRASAILQRNGPVTRHRCGESERRPPPDGGGSSAGGWGGYGAFSKLNKRGGFLINQQQEEAAETEDEREDSPRPSSSPFILHPKQILLQPACRSFRRRARRNKDGSFGLKCPVLPKNSPPGCSQPLLSVIAATKVM